MIYLNQQKRFLAILVVISLLTATTGQALPEKATSRGIGKALLPATAAILVFTSAFSGPATPLSSPHPTQNSIRTLQTGAENIRVVTAKGDSPSQASRNLFENTSNRTKDESGVVAAGAEFPVARGLSEPTTRSADFLHPIPAPNKNAWKGLPVAQDALIAAGALFATILGLFAASRIADRVMDSVGNFPTPQQTADYELANDFLVAVALPITDPESQMGTLFAGGHAYRRSIGFGIAEKRTTGAPNFLGKIVEGVDPARFESQEAYLDTAFDACVAEAKKIVNTYERDFFSHRHPWITRVVEKLLGLVRNT